ncbi:uncharacterized protein LOC123363557 isoform X2 [Mauremys mutica]|uniref:uncharacterized protein LOC123363557 isoform X2 n=1 Tax=Mauremys mutica TaxID=74926 RepID=UPI001D16521D|nr:uncharacterized protein LOC123363557 isoform X2 [Mauremys mutica]
MPDLLDTMLGNLLVESPDTDRLHNILEVFSKFFSERQRRFFSRWRAVLAIHDPLLRVSQAGLLLAYLLLGEVQQLMGDKDLHRVLPDLLDAILQNLLAEPRDTDRLHYILEHINYWIVSRVSQERARAIRSSTALLRFTIPFLSLTSSASSSQRGREDFSSRQRAVLAIHDPLLCVSQAGLLLAYSLLWETQQLMGDKALGSGTASQTGAACR